MKERDNVLEIFSEAGKLLSDKNISLLKELSSRTIHSASLGDADDIAVAVLIYALSKIYERSKYRKYKDWPKFSKLCEKNIEQAVTALKKNDIEGFRESITNIRKSITSLTGNLKTYSKEVFEKAKINKASRIYEHGISLEQTAKLLGITVWELADYIGKTGISDVDLSVTLSVGERMKMAKDMFKK